MSSLEKTTLIPRAALFGNPERGACAISPDGRWLAFVAPCDGVMNLWVCPRGELATARPLTHDRGRGITQFTWAFDGVHLLYQQDADGDENYHLYAVPVEGPGATRDLTPFAGVRALLQSANEYHRHDVLITLNRRDARYADLYRLHLDSGELSLVQENPGLSGFVADDQFRVRLAMAPQPDGSWSMLVPDGAGGWKAWQTIPALDAMTTHPLHFSHDGCTLYMLDSRGRDTAALVAFDMDANTAVARVVAEHPRADISDILTDVNSHEPIGYEVHIEQREFHALHPSVRADAAFLDAQGLGEWHMVSRSEDDRWWTVRCASDRNPASYRLYQRDAKRLTLLHDCYPSLAGAPLARMQATTVKSRDGLDLVCYLTLPVHAERDGEALASIEPLPMVLLVHGGPWARDVDGYSAEHQWLANRGYAVLSVNFRGSTGFGKSFVNAGDWQWGAAMDDDLCDAVDWAVARGVADAKRVAIMGASYGGYATLWALSTHADRYACGVDIVGPSNLETLLASTPPQWEAALATLHRQVGNPGTPEGRALLHARSPLHRANRISKPLLIGQGANDPRVKQAEADQMVAAMKANAIAVTYVLYPDEGHGFVRPPNRIMFNAITERFLAQNLGGRYEALAGGEIEGSSGILVEDSLANGG